MIYTTTTKEAIFASKRTAEIEALRVILEHEHIGYQIGFSCEGVTIHCNKKQEKRIKALLDQWRETINSIAVVL